VPDKLLSTADEVSNEAWPHFCCWPLASAFEGLLFESLRAG